MKLCCYLITSQHTEAMLARFRSCGGSEDGFTGVLATLFERRIR